MVCFFVCLFLFVLLHALPFFIFVTSRTACKRRGMSAYSARFVCEFSSVSCLWLGVSVCTNCPRETSVLNMQRKVRVRVFLLSLT